jgi:predicted dehydrogenase
MIRVGVVGLGMMGLTHLDVYSELEGVSVVAIADADPARRSGQVKAEGNVKGQAQGKFDITKVRAYSDGMELINDPEVDVVDICLPTPLHRKFSISALQAGKHLLVEKPLARTAADAFAIAEAAERASGIAMPAMCMRFWPGWSWLKQAIDEKRYGKVLAAKFVRLASHPGGPFYSNAEASGAAALDLHIHDADFVRFCFGPPTAVNSRGYSKVTTGVDHLETQYAFDEVPLVVAEGGWCMEGAYPFRMQYTVNFERATAVYDMLASQPLVLYEKGAEAAAVPVDSVMGYRLEIEYFINCVRQGRRPDVVTLRDGAEAVRLVEAEVQSVKEGRAVSLESR